MSVGLYAIFSFVTSIADGILALLFCHLLMHSEPVLTRYKVGWVLIISINNLIFDLLGIFYLYKSVLVVLWNIIYCRLGMKQGIGPSAFCSVLSMTVIYVFENVTLGLAKTFFHGAALETLMSAMPFMLFAMTFSRALMFVFVGLLLLVLRWKKSSNSNHVSRPYWILLSAAVCAFGSLVAFFNYSLTYRPELTASCLHWLSLFFIVALVLFLFLVIKLSLESERKHQMQTELVQTEQQLQQQDELYTMYSKLQGLRHDYRNHLQIIANLAVKKRNDELHAYLHGLTEDFLREDVHTGCPYVDSVLNSKLSLAAAHGIMVDMELHFPDKLQLDPVDLCACLFNLLDNAIQACDKNEHKENKRIVLVMEQWRGFLRVNCSNPSETAPVPYKNTFRSTKTGGMHGIGLHQLEKNAQKYEGLFEATYEQGFFFARLLLPHTIELQKLYVSHIFIEPNETGE